MGNQQSDQLTYMVPNIVPKRPFFDTSNETSYLNYDMSQKEGKYFCGCPDGFYPYMFYMYNRLLIDLQYKADVAAFNSQIDYFFEDKEIMKMN